MSLAGATNQWSCLTVISLSVELWTSPSPFLLPTTLLCFRLVKQELKAFNSSLKRLGNQQLWCACPP